jgi:hypothetical protein
MLLVQLVVFKINVAKYCSALLEFAYTGNVYCSISLYELYFDLGILKPSSSPLRLGFKCRPI